MPTNSAEMIFKIKADGSNAEAELRKVEAAIKRVGGSGGNDAISGLQSGFKNAAKEASDMVAIFTGNRLTGATSQITALSGAISAIPGPAGLAVGSLAALGAVAVTVVAGIFELTKSAAEYGAKIHDAKDETGLSAATLTTLKYAADNANSSFESVTKATAKFALLMGDAEKGSSKAQEKLQELHVTSKDLDEGFGQAVKTIANAKDGVDQITLAGDAFGKKLGAEMIPVIKQAGGDIAQYTEELEKLGVTLSDKDIKASDDFGDALGLLKAQASAASVAFTSDLMPVLTEFFTDSSLWYARNQGEVRVWGSFVADVFSTLGHVVEGWGGIVSSWMLAIDDKITSVDERLSRNQSNWTAWSEHGIEAVVAMFGPLGSLLSLLIEVNRYLFPAKPKEGLGGGPVAGPSLSPVGGGKGGRGGGGKDDAEAKRKKAVQEAERDSQQQLKMYQAQLATQTAEHKSALDQGLEDETTYTDAVGEIRLAGFLYEKQLNAKLLQNTLLNAEERKAIEAKQAVVTEQIAAERIKIGDDVYEKIKSQQEKETKAFEEKVKREKQLTDELTDYEKKAAVTSADNWMAGYERVLADSRSTFAERKAAYDQITQIQVDLGIKLRAIENKDHADRIAAIKKEHDKGLIDDKEYDLKLEAEAKRHADAMASIRGQSTPGAPPQGLSPKGVIANWKDLGPDGKTMQTIQQFADGIGQLAQNYILLGTAGPHAMQKLVASVLAGVAAQALVQAIMFTAYGLVALTPWGAAIYGPAAQWFEGAALMFSIAAGTGFAGRKIAGNSFKDASSSSSGGTANSYNTSPDAITRRGNGADQSGTAVNRQIQRLADSVDALHTKIASMSPGDVLTAGARQNPGLIGQHAVNDIRTNSGIGRNLNRALGNS